MMGYGNYTPYEPPREGSHKYYADDIETYRNGKWVSDVQERTCRNHYKEPSESNGLPLTKYDTGNYPSYI
jgi:hypothetical protein